MRIACWTNRVTDTHSEYVWLIALPRQQWLRDPPQCRVKTYVARLDCRKVSSFPNIDVQLQQPVTFRVWTKTSVEYQTTVFCFLLSCGLLYMHWGLGENCCARLPFFNQKIQADISSEMLVPIYQTSRRRHPLQSSHFEPPISHCFTLDVKAKSCSATLVLTHQVTRRLIKE